MLTTRLGTAFAAALALLVGVLAAAVTAPGGSGSPGSGELNLVAHSATAAHDAGTARAEFTMRMEVPGAPLGSVVFSGDGAFDYSAPAGRVRMGVDGGPSAVAGFEPSAVAGFEIEMLFTGTTVYMRSPVFREGLGVPTEWISIDAGALGAGDVFDQAGAGDPAQTLEFLRGASDGITEVGPETVRGVATTRYRATVDLELAAAAVPGDQRELVESAVDQFRAIGAPTTFPVEVWIDAEGLPRRVTYSLSVDVPEVGEMRMDLSLDLFDYGAPVDVAPPPAGAVTDLTDEMLADLGVGTA